jgi:hypothetical protein
MDLSGRMLAGALFQSGPLIFAIRDLIPVVMKVIYSKYRQNTFRNGPGR